MAVLHCVKGHRLDQAMPELSDRIAEEPVAQEDCPRCRYGDQSIISRIDPDGNIAHVDVDLSMRLGGSTR